MGEGADEESEAAEEVTEAADEESEAAEEVTEAADEESETAEEVTEAADEESEAAEEVTEAADEEESEESEENDTEKSEAEIEVHVTITKPTEIYDTPDADTLNQRRLRDLEAGWVGVGSTKDCHPLSPVYNKHVVIRRSQRLTQKIGMCSTSSRPSQRPSRRISKL